MHCSLCNGDVKTDSRRMQDVLRHAKTNCHMKTARIRQSVPSIDDRYFTKESDELKDKVAAA